MRATVDSILRFLTVVCACGLIVAYYRPWVIGPEGGVPPARLQETLEGPHKFLSLFKKDSRISRNYVLAPYLVAIPLSAGLAGLGALLPGPLHWLGVAAGILSVSGSHYLRNEVTEIPFHREGPGAVHTERLGYLLFGLSTLRGWFRPRRKRR